MNTFLDIETFGTQDPAVIQDISDSIQPPGNMSKAETIAKWENEKKPGLVDEAVRKTSLRADVGQVICIGMNTEKIGPRILWRSSLEISEANCLMDWISLVQEATVKNNGRLPTFVGHNIIGFDLPFLWRRLVVNNIRPPRWLPRPSALKPWSELIIDTMIEWAGVKERISLDRLCKILGIPGKDGIDGSMVWDYVLEGRFQEIADYCADDVERTRQCAEKMFLV